MNIQFKTLQDILDYATQRENDSATMYIELSKKIENPKIAEFLRELAREEIEHKQILQFETLKNGKTVNFEETIEILLPEPFEDQDDSLIDITYSEALVMAIKKEEMAFKLYSELATKVKNPKLKQALLELAEEEIRHKLRFEIEYERYSQQ